MNIYIRFAFLGSIFVLLFCALVIEISIIAEISRENKKRGCKKNQRPGKSDDPTRLNFCPAVESAKQGSEARQSPCVGDTAMPLFFNDSS